MHWTVTRRGCTGEEFLGNLSQLTTLLGVGEAPVSKANEMVEFNTIRIRGDLDPIAPKGCLLKERVILCQL